VRRLLKSYMTFLREAGADQDAFDQAFARGTEAWGALYWSWMAMPVSTEETIELLDRVGFEKPIEQSGEQHGKGACLTRAVEQELKCTSIRLHWYEYLGSWHC